MKILIKGAGDLATGIASRLYHAGHQIVMTEIQVPLTVRRSVALSRAVYEQFAEVEDMKAVLVTKMEEIREVLKEGSIPVIVDPDAEIADIWKPDVIVDAILAKRNLGTRITDADFVIGVGPGFTAGEDCNCVIETKRGHTLGNVIWEGSAIPNTGVPGNIGGFTIERLIRASAAGEMEPVAVIGEIVEKGQLVAKTGGCPVYAQMGGIVRGMLQPGVVVSEGLKIGDIDARCESEHCRSISDKARAIGGGVLEAVCGFERMRNRYGIAVLAAGEARRFGADKLSVKWNGKPLYVHTLEKVAAVGGLEYLIVTGNEKLASQAEQFGFQVQENKNPDLGISRSVKLAVQGLLEKKPELEGILFLVCDQPELKVSTIQKILREGVLHGNRIVCAGVDGRRGNPVFWGKQYFSELQELQGDTGGKQIMNLYEDQIRIVGVRERELKDIDRPSDLPD